MTDDEARDRLREISNLLAGLRHNIQDFPANTRYIQLLEEERTTLKKQFIRLVANQEEQ